MLTIQTPNGLLKGETLADIIKKHGKDCLSGADLSYADLSSANLCDVNLRYADLSYADLSHANLRYANLSYATLCDADLSYANLRYADLSHANLRHANLHYADLSHANLSGASLHGAKMHDTHLCLADLSHANMSYADLRCADLRCADLNHADLSLADLNHADLSGADLNHANLNHARSVPPAVIALTTILPDEGTIIGWKKAKDEYYNSVIVKLLIPANAQRSNATTRKCRTSEAKVLDIQNFGGESLDGVTAHSEHDKDFLYRKGETVQVDAFDMNRWNECASGIHFFITRWEAVHY